MCDVLKRAGEELALGVAGHVAKRLVDAQPATVGRDERDPDRRVIDHHPQALLDRLQASLRPAALGDIPDRCDDQQPVLGLDRAQRDRGRDLGAVLVAGVKVTLDTHRPDRRISREPGPVSDMSATLGVGDEQLHRLAQQLAACVPQQTLGLNVDGLDRTALIGDNHRVGRGLQQLACTLLGSPSGRLGAAKLRSIHRDTSPRRRRSRRRSGCAPGVSSRGNGGRGRGRRART